MAGFILDHRQHAVSSTSANLLIAGKIIRWGHRPGECLSGAQRTRGHRLFVGPRSVNRNDGVNQYLGQWTWFGWRHVAPVWTRTERTLSFVQEPPSLPGCPDSGSSRPDCVRGTTRRTYAGSDIATNAAISTGEGAFPFGSRHSKHPFLYIIWLSRKTRILSIDPAFQRSIPFPKLYKRCGNRLIVIYPPPSSPKCAVLRPVEPDFQIQLHSVAIGSTPP